MMTGRILCLLLLTLTLALALNNENRDPTKFHTCQLDDEQKKCTEQEREYLNKYKESNIHELEMELHRLEFLDNGVLSDELYEWTHRRQHVIRKLKEKLGPGEEL